MTSTRVQLWCAWSGPAFIVLFFSGMLVASLLPPPEPDWTAQRTAEFWRSDPDLKRLGLSLMMASTTFLAPFGVAIFLQLRRIPGAIAPAYTALAGAAVGMVAVVVPTIMMLSIALRPERDPEITQALTDLAFIPFVVNWPPALVQALGLGVGVLMDRRREDPVLPRWLGYYALWTGFLFLPGTLLVFFLDGVWAWNGILSFWLVAVLFGMFQLVVFVQVRAAILRAAATPTPAEPAPEAVPA
ncbi:hypothetical protein [Paraconexibacter algicola]|uniref:DUF4386 family protein n=1 Tax=Paraconexibacter algicola TaxID=2133960 RepID=A0A2T4ULQ2_9ACTN|nr:hypothetical protein [Paraconexibacter algicola]PTL60159.1 hypothetical protein C7Y72_11170 [Paraconexibacter algicola]